jgi:formamidopyrimidine-DNA glycosylase
MPELPEVETVRRALEPVLTRGVIEKAEILDSRLTRPFAPESVSAELVGLRVDSVERRGKYLSLVCGGGRVLLVHLRMTGSFRVVPRAPLPADPHRRAVLSMDNGSDVVYRDVRRFGTWELFGPGEAEPYLDSRLGPEPFDRRVTGQWLHKRLERRTAPLKSVLLDQRTLAGLGNIYVDEALWRASLHPRRRASSLDDRECTRLVRSIRAALRLGIARQGATLRDYAAPDGGQGAMQDDFRAYGRDGESCRRCRAMLSRIVVAGRGTTYCPLCQATS